MAPWPIPTDVIAREKSSENNEEVGFTPAMLTEMAGDVYKRQLLMIMNTRQNRLIIFALLLLTQTPLGAQLHSTKIELPYILNYRQK